MGWGVRGRERELSTMGKLERVYVVRSRTWLAMARFYSATTHPGGRFFFNLGIVLDALGGWICAVWGGRIGLLTKGQRNGITAFRSESRYGIHTDIYIYMWCILKCGCL